MTTNQEYAYLAEYAYKTLEPSIRDLKNLKPYRSTTPHLRG